MKKLVFLVLLVAFIGLTSAFATGIGVAAGLPIGDLPGSDVLLSLKVDQIPFLMGIGFTIGSEKFSFGLTGDYWVLNENLFSFVNYYLGPGFYIGYQNVLALGGRFPVGLNIFPIPNLELFVELAPTLAIQFSDPIKFPAFGLQSAFGFRFWF
jgi:hypothetical protein